jgi:2-C-methyl-D-erythritol 2,4-cyclodiphosphate synthase
MIPFRVGTGYDVHRLVAGRRLILGGVAVPHDRGLEGHSDADALAHAVIDAVLGACGLPDIGHHFPPRDARFKDADSIDLLAQTRQIAAGAGWRATNVDTTIICERPKLAPFVPEMRNRLAGALQLPLSSVNVKAKTNEGLDAAGRGEAIAVQAVVLVARVPDGSPQS